MRIAAEMHAEQCGYASGLMRTCTRIDVFMHGLVGGIEKNICFLFANMLLYCKMSDSQYEHFKIKLPHFRKLPVRSFTRKAMTSVGTSHFTTQLSW